ncbi:Na/Pi cotransporter family protein [Taklimakanibacter lacteus]|uniref:Na/Pi cotransporter family protein n=1 Tax=Taklimakanibacter lacteus TaxID=2268456 RepID=UPI000E65F95E
MTAGTIVIIELLGGVAMLLWGVRMVRTGIMRGWGDRLKQFIQQRLGNNVSAFAAGGMATAALGSATAMALIVAGLAASGAIGTSVGLAVLLGADVGSALVSALFASSSSYALWLSPLLLFAGYVTFSTSNEFRPHNFGRILIGFGLMLLSLRLIVGATAPLREASLFHEALSAIGREPVLAFLTGAVLAWLCHSTLAVILLIASFLANGSLDVPGALSFILGINCGGGLPSVTATFNLSPEARRLPLANLFCRGTVSIALLFFVGWIAPYVTALPVGPIEQAVVFHAGFNLLAALAYLPLTRQVSRLMRRIVPDLQAAPDNLSQPRYLDQMALATPSVALSNAALETVRMSELLDRMFDTAIVALRSGSLEKLKELKTLDERLNRYQTSVHGYLSDLTQSELEKSDTKRALEIMLYASNLEHAGDVIHLNLADRIKAKAKQSISFSVEQHASLDDLCLIISHSLRLATGVLTSNDIEGAKRLIAQKNTFRALENKIIDEHFRESGKARGASLRKSALYVDMIRDLHRVNSHIVSAGYPIIEAAGLLRDSRIRPEKKTK